MRIRAVTLGIEIKTERITETVLWGCGFLKQAEKFFSDLGHQVQSLRLVSQEWPCYLKDLNIGEVIKSIEEIYKPTGVECFSPGAVRAPRHIRQIASIIGATEDVYCPAIIAEKGEILWDAIDETARLMETMRDETEGGEGNFRFCATACCPPGSPFFPGASHYGPEPSFSIGTESPHLLLSAFDGAKDLPDAEKRMKDIFASEYTTLEQNALKLMKETEVQYGGIDVSMAPSMDENESLAYIFEKLPLVEIFGRAGTLSVAALITRVLKNLPVKKCGYSGLMLPVCEDPGLALRMSNGEFSLNDLLCFSSVCGTGLDTVPLPGDISREGLKSVLSDVATLAVTLNKPLSARLMPIPGKKAGEMTAFRNRYLVNCIIPKA